MCTTSAVQQHENSENSSFCATDLAIWALRGMLLKLANAETQCVTRPAGNRRSSTSLVQQVSTSATAAVDLVWGLCWIQEDWPGSEALDRKWPRSENLHRKWRWCGALDRNHGPDDGVLGPNIAFTQGAN